MTINNRIDNQYLRELTKREKEGGRDGWREVGREEERVRSQTGLN